ncbi:MAG TPA: arylsulfotransferase family protein, partial [Solirubrobacteraceae bacterium]|nr:arylsulfotransferase family protein [Solirubrobacteraceae bacterium]
MSNFRALVLGAGASLCLTAAWPAATQAAGSPSCAPARLDASALQDGAVTVSPAPGSRDASARTQVSFLGVPARELRSIRVVGSRTGVHRGRLLAYSQGDGASFVPSRDFAEGERVTVRARLALDGAVRTLRDAFTIAHADRVSSEPHWQHPNDAAEVQRFRSQSDLRPPVVTVSASSAAVAAGDVFLAPYGGIGQAGPMILEPNGGLLWFKPLPPRTSAANLQLQTYEGHPVLTWWQGDITKYGFGLGEDVIADGAYTEIAHVRAGNGLRADLHEFQLTPQGTALITAYHPILCNLSAVGGKAHGGVIDGV